MQVRRPPGLSEETTVQSKSGTTRPRLLLLAFVVVAALLVGLGVRTFVVRSLTVSASSMSPTVCPGDRVVVDLWDPDIADLARGDIVALQPPGASVPAVKRVVGLPGDEVAIRDALLYVNDRRVDEPYVDHETIDSLYYGPVVVPADRFLVMGDARETSIDSRDYGPVRADRLVGRVIWRLPVGQC